MPAPRHSSVPPPLLYAAFLLAVWLLQRALPLPPLPGGLNAVPALLFSLGGLAIFISALRALHKAGTTPSPYQAPTALVTTGPYRRTRNPIYFAFAWIYLGLAAWMNSPWALLLFPALILAMNRLVIIPEEEDLGERFGTEYLAYTARTRRWM